MTNPLRLRRRVLLGTDSSSVRTDIPGVKEHERSFDAGYEFAPVQHPLPLVTGGWDLQLAFFPFTVYTGGRRTRMPTLGLGDTSASGHAAMPTIVTTIEPTNGTGA